MIIIGVTWTLWAGKWTLVKHLVQAYWYKHLSVRAYLIQKILQRWLPINRDNMLLIANELRTKYWPWHITQELYQQAQEANKNIVIESIRNPWEVETLRTKWPFILFAIDADPSIRYQRILQRWSETDHISYLEFLSNEEREMSSTDPNKQNVQACIRLADYTLINNDSLEHLHKQIDEVMNNIVKQ